LLNLLLISLNHQLIKKNDLITFLLHGKDKLVSLKSVFQESFFSSSTQGQKCPWKHLYVSVCLFIYLKSLCLCENKT